MDAPVENVEAQVVEKRVHRVDWKINVSHVMLAVAVVALAYWLWSNGIVGGSSSSEEERGEFVDVEFSQEGLAR